MDGWELFRNEYRIDWKLHENALSVAFEVRPVTGIEDSPDKGAILYEAADQSEDNDTKDPEGAVLLINGSVKWDGCSDWSIDTTTCMLHFCGMNGVRAFSAVFERMYQITQREMPKFDAKLADMAEGQRSA